ncbi:MAG: PAS domain S-box protein [Sediminibacterium sp.]|nr:PAS domain S-box protein [Sediminibacterium sp.]
MIFFHTFWLIINADVVLLHPFWPGQAGVNTATLYTITGIALFVALAFFLVWALRRLRPGLFSGKKELIKDSTPPNALFEWLINSTDDAIVSLDMSGNIMSWNNAAQRMFEFTSDEIISKNNAIVIPEHLIEQERAQVERIKKGQTSDRYETIRLRKDGTPVNVSILISPIKDGAGNIVGISKIVQDISEKKLAAKKLEESEAKYKSIFENSPLPMWVLELPSFRFLAVNQTAIDHYGYSREEFLSMTAYEIREEQDRERLNLVDRNTPGYYMSKEIWSHLKKDGTKIDVEISAHNFIYEGHQARLIMSLDVTQRRESEARIQSLNEKIADREKMYRAVIENSFFGILLAKPDGTILESNKAASDLFGYTESEFRQMHRDQLFDLSSPEMQQKLKDRIQYGRIKGEITGIKKNGERFACEIASVIFTDTHGGLYTSNIISDISERVAAKRKEERNNALLIEAERIAQTGSVEIDAKTGERVWSWGFYKLLGYEPDSIRPDMNVFLGQLVPEDRDRYIQWYQGMIKDRVKRSSIEINLMRKDGEQRTFVALGLAYFDETGAVEKLIGVIQDITERKQYELQLEHSRQTALKDSALLKSIINSPKDVYIVALDKQLRLSTYTDGYNEHIRRLLGKDIQVGQDVFELIPGHLQEMSKQIFNRALNGEHFVLSQHLELTLGKTRIYENRYGPIVDQKGQVYGLTVFVHDVTEVKLIEQNNRLNEQRYSALFSGASDPIFIADVTTHCLVDVNSRALDLLGYTRAELIGMDIRLLHPPEEKEQIQHIFEQFARPDQDGANTNTAECHALHKSGKHIPISISAGSTFTIDKKMYSAAYFKDLTHVRASEIRVQRIGDLLNRAEGIAHIGSIEIDLQTQERIWSDEFYRILGYKPGEFKPEKERFLERIHADDREAYRKWYEKTVASPGITESFEVRLNRKDGAVRNLIISGMTYADDQGVLTKHIGVVMDITVRRILEADLIQSHDQLKKLTEMIPIAILQMESEPSGSVEIPFISRGIRNIYKGISTMDVMKNPHLITDWVVEEDRLLVQNMYKKCLSELTDLTIEYRVNLPKGGTVWVKLFYHPEVNETGNVVWYGYLEDITMQKQIHLNLERQNKQLKDIAWAQSHLVRAPLARLMGLVNMFKNGLVEKEEEHTFLDYLEHSADELDQIIKEITHKTILD